MTVSEYIYDFLSQKGINTAFMVSGSSAMWLVDALKRTPRFRVVCNNHEQASAMAADVYARTTDTPAICLVTVGPGASNAITGVAGAYMDSSPMIVLSGQSSSGMVRATRENGVRQMGTQSVLLDEMVKLITKYFAVIMDAADTRYHIEKALHEATSGRKGPVWLDVPVDIQNKQVPDSMKGFSADEPEPSNDASISDVCQWIKEAKRPLIFAGNGVRSAGAALALRKFAEKFEIPVILTRMGIDLMPSEHPLYIGRPGAYGDRPSHYALQTCDVLLCIGARMAVSSVGYNGKAIAPNARKIVVDIEEKEAYKEYVPMDAHFAMDAGVFLSLLLKEMNDAPDTRNWRKVCNGWKEKYSVVLPEYRKAQPLNSYYVVEEISKRAPANSVITVDTGTVCNVASQAWQLKDGQKYLISGGFSCMGFWAGALGAACAGNNQAIALTGDGSFQMNVQELATIAYYKLAVKLFVFENGGYLLIRLNQHNYMNDRFLGVGPDSGVGLPNIVAVAKAYGIKTTEAATLNELPIAIDEAFNSDGPVVCVIHTDPFQEMAPRMASKVMPDGSLKASAYEDLCPFLPDEEHAENMKLGKGQPI